MSIGLPNLLEIIANPEHFLMDYPLYRQYKGIIEDVNDPEKLGRVRVRIEEVWKSTPKCPAVPATANSPGNVACDLEQVLTEDLPWADVVIHGQGKEYGFFNTPSVGTAVIVIFEKGLEEHPLVIGGWWGTGEVPKAALGGDQTGETANAVKGKDGVSPPILTAGGGTMQEPANPYATTYPDNTVFRSPTGHLIEVDDTKNAERINIAHKSGSWAEFHPDGTLVFGIQGKRYTVVGTDDALHVKGNRDVVIDGDATHSSTNYTQAADGDFDQTIVGKKLVDVSGASELKAARVEIEGDSSVKILGEDTTVEGTTTLKLKSASAEIGAAPFGDIVTTLTHPLDFITGIPITGVPTVKAG